MPMHGLQMLVGLALWSRRCTPRNREFACLDRIAPRQFPQMKRLVKPTVPTPSPARYGHDIALSGELIPPDRLSRQGEICAHAVPLTRPCTDKRREEDAEYGSSVRRRIDNGLGTKSALQRSCETSNGCHHKAPSRRASDQGRARSMAGRVFQQQARGASPRAGKHCIVKGCFPGFFWGVEDDVNPVRPQATGFFHWRERARADKGS
jgi:hypothetical protein